MAGDTVILMDGVYKTALYVENSGTPNAWITFKADECATPIIEGPGVGPDSDEQDTGVGSNKAEYIRFQGIVSRGWNIGFGNGWTGGTQSDEKSNGHWEIEHCISYSNGRTGFTFFSAENFKLRYSISAHNGSSRKQSWSSGVTLFEAEGENVVEGVVSFENTDRERRTDGSGFIVDEESNGATFINNIAFGNAGSCLRLTRSSGTRFINNTCYHNSRFGNEATGPTNPGELYFTQSNGPSPQQGVLFMNNVIVGTGQAPAGSTPVINQPQSGWMNNVVTTGQVSFFTDPTGNPPNFVPASGAMQLIGAGSTGNGAPMNDIGFDPKCIVKRTPMMVGQVARESWWQYDIDIEYIQSIGGVAKCFNPSPRSGSNDIGAYKAGMVTTAQPGSCVPPEPEPDPNGGAGGMGGMSGMGGDGGTAGGDAGGMSGGGESGSGNTAGMSDGGTAGDAGGAPIAGAPMAGSGGGDPGASGSGGAPPAQGGTPGASGTAPTAGTPSTGTGGTPAATGGTGGLPGTSTGGTPSVGETPMPSPTADVDGCGCRIPARPDRGQTLSLVGLAGVGLLALRRRRRAR
ncbi:MAG: right-handed parallel beta-helix repeat-containing protein [Pseudomonadota bacterium]